MLGIGRDIRFVDGLDVYLLRRRSRSSAARGLAFVLSVELSGHGLFERLHDLCQVDVSPSQSLRGLRRSYDVGLEILASLAVLWKSESCESRE